MNPEKNKLGEQLYTLIKDDGPPWGVGTTAVIAGLGVRLLHMVVKNSGDQGFSGEIKTFFYLCDEDDYLFDNYLQHKQVKLNKVPIKMQNMILLILEKVLREDYEIKDDFKVDFNMGVQYLLAAAKQTMNIMCANELEGISEQQFTEWQKKLLHIQEKAFNNCD